MKKKIAAAALLLLAGCGEPKTGGADPLDQNRVREVVGKLYTAGEPGTMVVNEWKKVVIGAPRAATAGEVQAVPAGTKVYPVAISLTQKQTRNGTWTVNEIRQDYLFYRTGDGAWAAAAAGG